MFLHAFPCYACFSRVLCVSARFLHVLGWFLIGFGGLSLVMAGLGWFWLVLAAFGWFCMLSAGRNIFPEMCLRWRFSGYIV